MKATPKSNKFVTPYAFHVAASLLGTPLASPSRRLAAILIDMTLVGLLTTLSTLILTGLIGVLAAVGANSLRRRNDREVATVFLAFVAFICLTIVVFGTVVGDKFSGSIFEADIAVDVSPGADRDSPGSVTPRVDAEFEDDDNANPVIDEADTETSAPGLIVWVQGIFKDLGLSFGWAAVYFTAFLAWMNGQTPGKLIFGIRVIRIDGRELGLWDSFGRYGGYGAGLATGLLGFLQIYWDSNRQAIQDKISETMVVDIRKPRSETSIVSAPVMSTKGD